MSEPGWQPDPTGRHHHRYWDGVAWTDQVADGGVVSTDPQSVASLGVDEPPRSKVPVGLLALAGLAVLGIVAAIVIFASGGDDGGAGSEDAAEVTEDGSDTPAEDVSEDVSDSFSDDLSDLPGGDVSANDLEVGDCVEDEATLNSADVEAVDCTLPHAFELFGRFEVPDGEFPGEAELSAEGQEQCHGELFEDYVGVPYSESLVYASPVPPSEETWERGDDRTILCFAHEQDLSTTTGSYEGTGR